MKDALVVQSYGSENDYKRAIFSIWSFYAWSSMMTSVETLLFTDNPDYFRPFVKGLPVNFVFLSRERIKSMRGEIDFVHRVKIVAIQEAFERSMGNIFYIDSDTFFIANPDTYLTGVAPDRAYMHAYEYVFKEMKSVPLPGGKTFHVFYDFIMSKDFTFTNGNSFRITDQQVSWNAGVIILHRQHQSLLPDVLKLTDNFYPFTKNHGCEQYAFSIVLSHNTRVCPCDDVIYHYWVVVKKGIVDVFLNDRLNQEWDTLTFEKKISSVRQWTLEAPRFIQNHFQMLRYEAAVAFNEDRFRQGFQLAARAIWKRPLNVSFWRDVFYHVRRKLVKRDQGSVF